MFVMNGIGWHQHLIINLFFSTTMYKCITSIWLLILSLVGLPKVFRVWQRLTRQSFPWVDLLADLIESIA